MGRLDSEKYPQYLETKFSLRQSIKRDGMLYIMLLPAVLYYLIFCYVPMFGAMMAFQDYQPTTGFFGSKWVGIKHFKAFIQNYYFWNLLRNTFRISLTSIVFGFPAPIILALLINEIRFRRFKSFTQTITYMPHFISMVVVCGMIRIFVADDGLVSRMVGFFTGENVNLLNYPEYFVPIYIISDIWQDIGWNSIIYLAALASVDITLYEAATIDGAGKLRQTWHITLPGIMPTITIMLILRMGGILSVGYEKIILLYNPITYETADVISSFVYRKGLLGLSWSYSSAVGLLNSVVNFAFVFATNQISKKCGETSLW